MILHGRNLIIIVNDSVVAASKSCSLDVDVEAIKCASPTDGLWEHVREGRKTWSVSTSQLMPSVLATKPLITGYSPSWVNISEPVMVTVGGLVQRFGVEKGLTVFDVFENNGVFSIIKRTTYNTGFDDSAAAQMAADLEESHVDERAVLILSHDYWALPATLVQSIMTNLHVANVPTLAAKHGAIAIIGSHDSQATGICMYSEGMAGSARAAVHLEAGVPKTVETVLRNAVARVGQMVSIRVHVDGYGADYLTGTALCKSFTAQGTEGNLLTGSFKFQGSGPLT